MKKIKLSPTSHESNENQAQSSFPNARSGLPKRDSSECIQCRKSLSPARVVVCTLSPGVSLDKHSTISSLNINPLIAGFFFALYLFMGQEGNLSRGLRANSTTPNNQRPTRHIVRRAHSYTLNSSNDTRKSDDLRHTALRNELQRVNSMTNVESHSSRNAPKNKNIPMKLAPPIGQMASQKWGAFTLHQNDKNDDFSKNKDSVANSASSKVSQKSSISPLTQMQQPTAGRNIDNEVPREAPFGSPVETKFLDTNMKNAQFDRKSEHNSMFSLARVARSDSEVNSSVDQKEDDIEATYEDNFEEAFLQIPGLANTTSILDFMTDVRGSGNGRKSDVNVAREAKAFERPMTRTHQKVLDMKSLNYDDKNKKGDIGKKSSKISLLAGRSSGYAVKIQHESIVSQWTQIRLRFSSKSEVGPEKPSVTCRAGVLGSIRRLDNFNGGYYGEVPEDTGITKDNVDAYLFDMWHGPSFGADMGFGGGFGSDFVNGTDGMGDLKDSGMSAMAKNIMMTRT